MATLSGISGSKFTGDSAGSRNYIDGSYNKGASQTNTVARVSYYNICSLNL